jgi:hypothetical protein
VTVDETRPNRYVRIFQNLVHANWYLLCIYPPISLSDEPRGTADLNHVSRLIEEKLWTRKLSKNSRAMAAKGFHVGHPFVRHDGDDMHVKCSLCGAEETVTEYSNGKHPQKFVYQPTRMDG